MENQVPENIKEKRNHDLLGLVNAWAKRRSDTFVGHDVEILCEGPSKTNAARLMGRTRGNKIVVFEGNESYVGRLLDIRILRSTGFTLFGEVAEVATARGHDKS
jgi:tRNA-2-methylthio-N6-dimethylallyladenosine synthase